MPPALQRGLARPSALNFPLTSFLRSFHLGPRTAARRRREPVLPLTPLVNLAAVRQELENAQRDANNVASDYPPDPSPKPTRNFLARLTSWIPLFRRLKFSHDAFGTFRHEADVCNRLPVPHDAAARLVDQAEYAQSVSLWLEILRFRLRLDGQEGFMDVVQAVVHRRILLPLRGEQADAIWSLLLWSAVQNPPMLRLLYPYLVETILPANAGLGEIPLYERIVGPLLRQNPMFALTWHKRMQADGLIPADPSNVLLHFVELVCLSSHRRRAIEAFKKIYISLGLHSLYDAAMLHFCRLTDFETAVDMHAFFARHDDHPAPHMRAKPFITHLIDNAELAKTRFNLQASVEARFKSKASLKARARFVDDFRTAHDEFLSLKPSTPDPPSAVAVPLLTRESMSTIVGDVHNIREKELNDAFCARLFATTAFSVDLITTALRMLGLQTVGNLALREIAARAPSPSDYLAMVDAIKASGVTVIDSIFSRALESFAAQPSKHHSFDYLLTSDQHPTAYEDRSLQKQLFGSFLTSAQHREANATLHVLTLDESDPDSYHANLILQTYARRGRHEATLQVLHEMRSFRIPVSEASLRVIQWIFLRRRAVSKKPITYQSDVPKDDLDFTTNVLLETMRTGQMFNPSNWREILKRYGMENRLESLEKLSIWLALWYSGRHSEVVRPLLSIPTPDEGLQSDRVQPFNPGTGGQHPFAKVFTKHLLRAMIAWGFKSDVIPPEPMFINELKALPDPGSEGETNKRFGEAEHVQRWARGLALVRKLQRLGVNALDKTELIRETKIRLWILYGPGKSAVPHNRQARRQNKMPLVDRVAHIHKVMGRNWLQLPPSLQGRHGISDSDMYAALFGQPRRMRRRSGVLTKSFGLDAFKVARKNLP